MPHLLVFGARNLGRVVAEHLTAQGWEATGVSRTEETAAAFPGTGIVADATTADGIRSVVCSSVFACVTWSDASSRVWLGSLASAVVVTHFVTRRPLLRTPCREGAQSECV